jgi:endonuclease/exonuclease/phosphatase family metal-dependent hydrolase
VLDLQKYLQYWLFAKNCLPGKVLGVNCFTGNLIGAGGPGAARCALLLGFILSVQPASGAEKFRVACFNLNNYLAEPAGNRPLKSDASKAKVRESLRALDAHVIHLEEMGSTNALLELRESLRREGLDYPFWEHVTGADTNIHLAVLSRFPITARRPHTNEAFLLFGKRFPVSRGFSEVDIQVKPNYSFTLLGAHLKSRLPVPAADQADLREQEAILLRETIDAILTERPNAKLIVLGDLNDTRDTRPIKALLGRQKLALVDTRPAERNGDDQPNTNPRYAPPRVTWTYYYAIEDSYSRIDYILLSKGMAREWDPAGTYVLALPNWGVASDHRPIVAAFEVGDR